MKNGLLKILLALIVLFISMPFSISAATVGVLVLAHGGSSTWQAAVSDAVRPLREKYPVEIAFGMADPATIEKGLGDLEDKLVTDVIVVPLFISSYSPIIRQTEYLLGLRSQLADEPMLDHNHGQMEGHGHNSHEAEDMKSYFESQVELQPLQTELKIKMTRALDDHPLVAEILLERILELSRQPEQETIVLVAHGPNGESDNRRWVQSMELLSAQVRNLFDMKSGEKFRNIFCLTVRDDADTSIYEQAKEHLRGVVRQAGSDGKVLVIPLYLSHGGVEGDIVARLEGLAYEWSGRTLLPADKITDFIKISVSETIGRR